MNRTFFQGFWAAPATGHASPPVAAAAVDGKPVAICRLKRVAADNRDDISESPKAPREKNGKRVALIGAGPSSLTVANDLMPLGYEVVIYEKLAEPGGLMRINIPSFRLPASVLDDEVGYILNMGVDIRYNSPVTSMRSLLAEGYDAVFVGSGAPTGKNLDIPAARKPPPTFTSASSGSRRRTLATSSGLANAYSSSVSATPQWTAAARHADSEEQTSRSSPGGPASTSRHRRGN